jgi:hypothetical protein
MKKTLKFLNNTPMKKLLLFLSVLLSFTTARSQFIYKIKADSVLITNDSCTAELNLENSTKNIKGFLYNKGNGRTEFRKVQKLNDSTIIIGADTISLAGNINGISANNGLSKSGNTIVLGANTNQAGNPGALLSDRELIMDNFNLNFKFAQGSSDLVSIRAGEILLANDLLPTFYQENRIRSGDISVLTSNAGVFTGVNIRSLTDASVDIYDYNTKLPFLALNVANGGNINTVLRNNNGVFELRSSNSINRLAVNLTSGNVGVGITPTAALHIKAGTATANTAPLKFTSGTSLTTPEAGAIEYNGTSLFFTPGSTRYNFLLNNLGLSGGQTIVGGTASGDNLTLSSTSNATKGSILFGTSAYDEANNRLGIGTTSSTARLHIAAGTSSANTAPLKFTSGTNLTAPEAGAVEFDGTNYYATASTTRYTLAKTLTTTATLDFSSTAAGAKTDLTITVTGAADGDVVSIGVPNGSTVANGSFTAWVSASNTVTVRFTNNDLTNSYDPASGTFRVSVLKY